MGMVDYMLVYLCEVVKCVFEFFVLVLILVYNYFFGDLMLFLVDVKMICEIIEVVKFFGIMVYDYIIVGWEGYVSFKGLCLI